MWTYGRAFRQSVVLVMLACFAGMGRGQIDARTNGAARSSQTEARPRPPAARTQRHSAKAVAHRQTARSQAAGGSLTAGNIYSFAGAIANAAGIGGSGGTQGFGSYAPGDDTASADQAGLGPTGVALDAAGNLYIADYGNDMIREVPAGTNPGINRLVGTGWTDSSNTTSPIAYAGAQINSCGLILYDAESATCNLDGQGPPTSPTGDVYDANFNLLGAATTFPQDLKVDANGNVYFLDSGDQVLEVLYKKGTVTGLIAPMAGYLYTLAGTLESPTIFPVANGPGSGGGTGEGGPAASATFGGITYPNSTFNENVGLPGGPAGLFVDAAGNIYIADTANNLDRVIYQADPAPPVLAAVGITVTEGDKGNIYTITGSYILGQNSFTNACGSGDPNIAANNCGDGGLATSAWLSAPQGIYVDVNGNVFIADFGDNLVRAIYVKGGSLPGIANPVAGNLYTIAGDVADVAQVAVTVPVLGGNGTAMFPANACLTTTPNNCGDGGLALSARLFEPAYLTEDGSANIYISDSGDNVVRVLYQSGQLAGLAGPLTVGSLYTYAGTIVGAGADSAQNNPNSESSAINACDPSSETNDCGNTGAAVAAELNLPQGLAFDANNNLYVADWYDGAVREVAGIAPLQAQTITFPAAGTTLPASVVYGNAPIQLNATATSELPVSFSVSGAGKLVGSTAVIESVGTITITASQAGGPGFLPATPVTVEIQVTPAMLTVTGKTLTLPFGSAIPSYAGDYTITGFVYGQSQIPPITGMPDITSTYTPATPIGMTVPLVVTPGNLAATPPNYTFTFVNGSITVTGSAAQTITFPAIPNQTYGAAPFTLNATSNSGLPITYTVSAGAPVTLNGAVLTITGAATAVTVTASQAGNSVYAPATSVSHTFAINPAPLSVAANNVSVIQGGTIPPLTYSVAGFVNGDTQASATSGMPTLSLSVASTAPFGTYPITITAGTFVAPNYTPSFVNGSLTIIAPTPQSINFTAPASPVTYGVSNIPLMATASSGLPVTLAIASGPGILVGGSAVQVAGAGTITITASQPGNSVYGSAPTVTRTILVAPAPLTVTATSYTLQLTSPVPSPIAPIYSGFVNGETAQVLSGVLQYDTTYTPSSDPGVYPITPDPVLNTLTSPNYTITVLGGTITVLLGPAPDFTLSPPSASITMAPGQLQQLTVLITPMNGYDNPYTSSTGTGGISFSCANLPANVTCNFSPTALGVNGSDTLIGASAAVATSTLTISASSAPLAMMGRPGDDGGKNHGVLPAAIFLLPGVLAGAFVGFHRKRFLKNTRGYQMLVLLCLLAGVMGMSACGYSNTQNTSSFAKPGTSTITVQAVGAPANSATGATGAITHTIDVTVTIQ